MKSLSWTTGPAVSKCQSKAGSPSGLSQAPQADSPTFQQRGGARGCRELENWKKEQNRGGGRTRAQGIGVGVRRQAEPFQVENHLGCSEVPEDGGLSGEGSSF